MCSAVRFLYYIVSLSPESFELNRCSAGLLALPTFVYLLARLIDNGIAERKHLPIAIGTGLQLRGQLRN